MKSLIDPFDTGGAPIYNDDLLLLQNGGLNTLKAHYSAVVAEATEGLIVSGCEVTDVGGGNWQVDDGIVFIQGDFYSVSATTNTAGTVWATPAVDVIEQRVFRDGSPKNVITVKTADIVTSLPGGQRVSFPRLGTVQEWRYFSDDTTFGTGWADASANALMFRKDQNNTVHIRGKLDAVSAISNIITGSSPYDDILPGTPAPLSTVRQEGLARRTGSTSLTPVSCSNVLGNFSLSHDGTLTDGEYSFNLSYQATETWQI